jgi:hypothetical protein
MKLTPGVNFTNILRATFTRADPKKPKNDSQVISSFCAFPGSALEKAAHKTLMKLTPGY